MRYVVNLFKKRSTNNFRSVLAQAKVLINQVVKNDAKSEKSPSACVCEILDLIICAWVTLLNVMRIFLCKFFSHITPPCVFSIISEITQSRVSWMERSVGVSKRVVPKTTQKAWMKC